MPKVFKNLISGSHITSIGTPLSTADEFSYLGDVPHIFEPDPTINGTVSFYPLTGSTTGINDAVDGDSLSYDNETAATQNRNAYPVSLRSDVNNFRAQWRDVTNAAPGKSNPSTSSRITEDFTVMVCCYYSAEQGNTTNDVLGECERTAAHSSNRFKTWSLVSDFSANQTGAQFKTGLNWEIDSTTTLQAVTTSYAPHPNQWNHLAATRDASGNVNFYINGTLVATGAASVTAVTPADTSMELAMGPAGGGNPHMVYSQYVFYNTVLTSDQIREEAAKVLPDDIFSDIREDLSFG